MLQQHTQQHNDRCKHGRKKKKIKIKTKTGVGSSSSRTQCRLALPCLALPRRCQNRNNFGATDYSLFFEPGKDRRRTTDILLASAPARIVSGNGGAHLMPWLFFNIGASGLLLLLLIIIIINTLRLTLVLTKTTRSVDGRKRSNFGHVSVRKSLGHAAFCALCKLSSHRAESENELKGGAMSSIDGSQSTQLRGKRGGRAVHFSLF